MEAQVVKEPIKISLFKSFMNVAFAKLIKWKVLGDPKTLVIVKEHMTGEMFVNQKQKMHFLRLDKEDSVFTFESSEVSTIIISKDNIIIRGKFNGDKKNDISIQGNNEASSMRTHTSSNKK